MVSGGEEHELRLLSDENARLTESEAAPTHFTTGNRIALFRRTEKRRKQGL